MAKTESKTAARLAEHERMDVNNEYLVSKMEQDIQQTMPSPKRITVAVLVDGSYNGENGKQRREFVARSPDELGRLQKLVEATIGFKPERQDVVTVECSPFRVEDPPAGKEPSFNFQSRQLIQTGMEWGIVGLLGLLL